MSRIVITVFGSGTAQPNSRLFQLAYETGFRLAKAGFNLANGGYEGCMLASANGAKEGGAGTIGVTTDDFPDSVKNQFIDREIRKRTWRERLHELVDVGDGYLVLDGGTGTLTELAVIWEMRNKNFHHKPIAVLGRYMQAFVKASRKNPEVRIPEDMHFASKPEHATRYLAGRLIHA